MTPASVAEGVGFAGVDTLAVALVEEEDDNVEFTSPFDVGRVNAPLDGGMLSKLSL